jgi:protein-S-isoprenylcysteine O-methyltransferase Ste14
MWRHLLAILVLPANVLVTVPALILWRRGAPEVPSFFAFTTDLGLLAIAVGLSLMAATIRLFVRVGRGTLAPWMPTERLVVLGPYRWVRNPMISGVLFVLLGEALLFRSWQILAWWALFFAANAVYLPLAEEPGLEQRFGEDYRRYKRDVPRWIPRLVPVPPRPPAGP